MEFQLSVLFKFRAVKITGNYIIIVFGEEVINERTTMD